jgi:DNA repair protein RadC
MIKQDTQLMELRPKYVPTGLDVPKGHFTSSAYAYEYIYKHIFDADSVQYSESAYAIYMNRQNNVIAFSKISEGAIDGTVIDVRKVLAFGLLCGAVSIIISHNHPSGNKRPSQADDDITKKLAKAGNIMEIKVLDHIIVTADGYYSYADEGRI